MNANDVLQMTKDDANLFRKKSERLQKQNTELLEALIKLREAVLSGDELRMLGDSQNAFNVIKKLKDKSDLED